MLEPPKTPVGGIPHLSSKGFPRPGTAVLGDEGGRTAAVGRWAVSYYSGQVEASLMFGAARCCDL